MRIRQTLLIVLAVAVGALSVRRAARAGGDDARLLQGKWRVVSARQNGGSFPKDRVGKMFVAAERDELRVSVERATAEQAAKFTLDPKQDPKHIDFAGTRDRDWADQPHLKLFRRYKWADGKPVPADGIYRLDGDTLTLCWGTTEARDLVGGSRQVSEPRVRPGVFQSHLYYHQFLFVLERVKPEK